MWALVGANNEICGPEVNGMFTTVLFVTEDDAYAALKAWEVPAGTVVRRMSVTIEADEASVTPLRKAGA